VRVDLERLEAEAGPVRVQVSMPEGARKQLIAGRWDSSAELLEGAAQTAKAAASLPYFGHWQS
jgi:hypothetical protein